MSILVLCGRDGSLKASSPLAGRALSVTLEGGGCLTARWSRQRIWEQGANALRLSANVGWLDSLVV